MLRGLLFRVGTFSDTWRSRQDSNLQLVLPSKRFQNALLTIRFHSIRTKSWHNTNFWFIAEDGVAPSTSWVWTTQATPASLCYCSDRIWTCDLSRMRTSLLPAELLNKKERVPFIKRIISLSFGLPGIVFDSWCIFDKHYLIISARFVPVLSETILWVGFEPTTTHQSSDYAGYKPGALPLSYQSIVRIVIQEWFFNEWYISL